jgi:hypothetical protein
VTNTATATATTAQTTQSVTASCTSPARLIGGGAAATAGTQNGRVAIEESVPTNAAGTTTAPFDRWRGTLVILTGLTMSNTATIRAWAVCITP